MPICSSGTQCPLYSAASLGQHVIGPHANPPSHIILTPGRPVMFRGRMKVVPYRILKFNCSVNGSLVTSSLPTPHTSDDPI